MLYVHIKEVQESKLIMQIGNPKTGWGLWLQWVAASMLGYGVGTTIGNALANLIPAMTCTQSFADSFIDRLPWLVLHRRVPRAGWWMPAHLLGSLAGGALGIVAFHSVGLIGFYQFAWAAAGAMFGAGLGAITGIALVWLLRKSVSEA